MPRRPPRDLTPSESRTPTGEGALTPTDAVPLPLPKPPSMPRPPKLPPPGVAPVARPGRRDEHPSDMSMTAKIERLPRRDPTPAPLPPSPGARDAERWFEQVPTNPAAQAVAPDPTGSHRYRKSSQLGVAEAPTTGAPPRSWLLIGLIAAIALTIGMILGGLLFGHSGSTKCEPCTQQSPLPGP